MSKRKTSHLYPIPTSTSTYIDEEKVVKLFMKFFFMLQMLRVQESIVIMSTDKWTWFNIKDYAYRYSPILKEKA